MKQKGRGWKIPVLTGMMLVLLALPAYASSAYMKSMPVAWDLKPETRLTYQTCYAGIGMKDQEVILTDWEIKDAAKAGFKELSFRADFIRKWDMSREEVSAIAAGLNGSSQIGGNLAYMLVDYETGKSLECANEFGVTCSNSGWTSYAETTYYGDNGDWVNLSNSWTAVTVTYPEEYHGAALGVGGSTSVQNQACDSDFFDGRGLFGDTTFQSAGYPALSHFMRINNDPSIKLNQSRAILYTTGSKTLKLKATVVGDSKKVTWKSSDTGVAAVDSKGKVTAKKAGTAKITATANGKSAACKVTVKKPAIKLSSKKTLYLAGKKTVYLNARVTGPSYKVKWKSSNTKVATVNSSGKVTARKTGTATISATANGVTAKCKITVKKLVNWRSLYKAFLSQYSATFSMYNGYSGYETKTIYLSPTYFTVGDINKDGLKELFVRTGEDSTGNVTSTAYIFTIIDGEVVCTGSTYNLGPAPEISSYGGVYSTWYGAGADNFFILSIKGDQLYFKLSLTRGTTTNHGYSMNDKAVSKATYDKYYNLYSKSLVKTYAFRYNTALNRNQFFG